MGEMMVRATCTIFYRRGSSQERGADQTAPHPGFSH